MDALLLRLDLLDQLLEIGLLGNINISNTGRVISNAASSNYTGIGHTERSLLAQARVLC